MARTLVGIDVGGTKILGGLVATDGDEVEVLSHVEVPAPRDGTGVDPGLAALTSVAERLRDEAGRLGRTVEGVGVGLPEYVVADEVRGFEVLTGDRQPLEAVSLVFPGVPTVVDSDVRCAAVAEAAARAVTTSLFYVSWGTGLSSTLVLDGRAVAGHRGEALALGEWPVHPRVDPTWTGNLETFAAGRSLGLRYGAPTGGAVEGREVVARALAGDPVAAEVVESAARAVAHALAQVVHLLDPALVVLGGGLGTSGTALPARTASLLPTLLHRPGSPTVEPAVAGPAAGMVGAALASLRE